MHALPPARAPDARVRVLVVDDVPEILMVFRDAGRRLHQEGLEVVVEANAERAIQRIRTEPFDVVISDCRMREADGVSVLTAARQTRSDGLRIMMTGYQTIPATLERVHAMDADAYLQKPIALRDLLQLLQALAKRDPSVLKERRLHARTLERIADLSQEEVRLL